MIARDERCLPSPRVNATWKKKLSRQNLPPKILLKFKILARLHSAPNDELRTTKGRHQCDVIFYSIDTRYHHIIIVYPTPTMASSSAPSASAYDSPTYSLYRESSLSQSLQNVRRHQRPRGRFRYARQ